MRSARLVSSTVLVSIALGWSTQAHANVVTLTPSKDNTMYEEDGTLSNGVGGFMFCGNTDNLDARRSLLAFDVAASIPAGAVINSVTLKVTCQQSAPFSGARTHTLHRATASWGEGTSDAGDPGGMGAAATTGDATWTHNNYSSSMWSSAGGDYAGTASGSVSVNAAAAYTFASTAGLVADVQAWLDTPGTNYGWAMLGDESAMRTAKKFSTREEPVVADRPTLTVDFTPPVPAMPSWGLFALTTALLASGTVLVARRARTQPARP